MSLQTRCGVVILPGKSKKLAEFIMISVIVPLFNGEKYIRETLDSVINQTYLNWECIIVDDGSTDNSATIAKEYVAKDQRIKYFQQNNAGPSQARNYGLQLAKGRYIQFLDADDVLLKERFQVLIESAEKLGTNAILFSDFYLGNSQNIYETSKLSRPASIGETLDFNAFYKYFGIRFLIVPCCILLPRDCFQYCRWETSLSHSEDWDLYLKLTQNGWEFRFIAENLAIYRNNPLGLSKKRYETILADIQILERYWLKELRWVYFKRTASLLKKGFFNKLLKGDKIVDIRSAEFKASKNKLTLFIILSLSLCYITIGLFEIVGKKITK